MTAFSSATVGIANSCQHRLAHTVASHLVLGRSNRVIEVKHRLHRRLLKVVVGLVAKVRRRCLHLEADVSRELVPVGDRDAQFEHNLTPFLADNVNGAGERGG